MSSEQEQPPVPAKREPTSVPVQKPEDAQVVIGYIPRSGDIDADERIAITREEGYDPMAIELALELSETTIPDKLRLLALAILAAVLVVFFFPIERFFKPITKALGTMTIGGPTVAANLSPLDIIKKPWLKVLLEIDRLYFQEGKLTDAIQLAEAELEKVPEKNWEIWQKVHYRYWELLSDAGRVNVLKTATQAYLQIRPEDPFANYYHAHAFLAATDRIRSFDKSIRQSLRDEAESIIARVDRTCSALIAQRKYPDAEEKETILTELYQKLRLAQARLYVLMWKLGGYEEDDHPDVVYRDQALDICDSAELANLIEAKELKVTIYTSILDRWYWFEGQQVIQGTKQRRKALSQELDALQKELKKAKKL